MLRGVMMSALLGATVVAGELPPVSELPVVKELPDLLTMFDGTPVKTKADWQTKRRPELVRLIQHYEYGYLPPKPVLESKLTKTVEGLCDGKVTLHEIELRFADLPESAPKIRLALFLPAQAAGPVPVFLGLNPCGNAEILDDEAITFDETAWKHKYCEKSPRGGAKDFWCVDYLAARGYAFATFHESDVDPDQHDFTDGIHPYYQDQPVPEKSRPGTIAAWAWGLQRGVDYLVTHPQIDPKRICLIGHSRRGKTALLAAATDERVALVVPHQSGTGGMALSRDTKQETVERINRVFPHWFSDQFTEFNDAVERLPFDQHALVALVAPRPLLDTEGAKDPWANYPRSLDALRAADPVYKLLGASGVEGTGLVENDEPIVGPNFGSILQYRLDVEHTLNRKFWEKILDFADAQAKRSAGP